MRVSATILRLFLISAFMLTVKPFQAKAGHYQGAELSYSCIAPNVYVVSAKIFRDCIGLTLGTAEIVNLKSPGCNTGRNITLNHQAGPGTIGNPYCGVQQSSPCNSTAPPNFEIRNYSSTVVFNANEQSCPDWFFSLRVGNRSELRNLANASTRNLYVEAYLKLNNTINNNSPQFGEMGIAFPYLVNVGKKMVCSFNATEPDGDSIAYSLVNPLDDFNAPIPFANINAAPFLENKNPAPPYNTTTNKQYAAIPAQPSAFSSSFPLPSYEINWNSPSPIVPATPYFDFDSQSGSLTFTPSVFNANAPASSYPNSYVITVQADEYRKINGTYTKIGHIRRDMFTTVVDGTNENPDIPALVANNTMITPNTIINLQPGTPLNLQFSVVDPNLADVVNMQTNVTQMLPGATFMKNTSNQPTGTVTWTPTAAHVRSFPYFFTVYLRDNGCPVAGLQARTIGVSVTTNGSVSGIKPGRKNQLQLTAFPNPFSEQINFNLKLSKATAGTIYIYSLTGREIDKIDLKNLNAGEKIITWNNSDTQPVGQYIARLITEAGESQIVKFIKQ